MHLYRIDWGELSAIEPTEDEVRVHAPALAVAYNDPRNAPLMGHTSELVIDDVVEHLTRPGARNFLLFRDGVFAGDADLRGLDERRVAEFAFMIGDPGAQGRGLGTRFALMIHAFGFRTLELARVWASVLPENTASRRVFGKLGYRDAPELVEEDGDLGLAVERADFLASHAGALAEIRIALR